MALILHIIMPYFLHSRGIIKALFWIDPGRCEGSREQQSLILSKTNQKKKTRRRRSLTEIVLAFVLGDVFFLFFYYYEVIVYTRWEQSIVTGNKGCSWHCWGEYNYGTWLGSIDLSALTLSPPWKKRVDNWIEIDWIKVSVLKSGIRVKPPMVRWGIIKKIYIVSSQLKLVIVLSV